MLLIFFVQQLSSEEQTELLQFVRDGVVRGFVTPMIQTTINTLALQVQQNKKGLRSAFSKFFKGTSSTPTVTTPYFFFIISLFLIFITFFISEQLLSLRILNLQLK